MTTTRGAGAHAVVDDHDVRTRLADTVRMRRVRRTRLLDAPPRPGLDRITRIATRLLGVPVALVSILDVDRQFFASAVGLGEPWASSRQTPLSHSFCKYVVVNDLPLVVADARGHDLVGSNRAIPDLGVVAYAGFPIHDDEGTPIGAFCAIQDRPRPWSDDELDLVADLATMVEAEVHLRAALEHQQQSQDARRDTLAMLAHDLRTPLAALASGAQILRSSRGRLSDQIHDEVVGVIERQATHARELTDRLLLADGALPAFAAVELDVGPFLVEAVEALRRIAPDATIVTTPASLAVALDPIMTRQVVANLVGNAVAHGGAGVVVTVSASVDGDDVVLEVRDNGVGIPAAAQERVFDRFVSGPDSAGHGLGLHIVQRLAQAMGGGVCVESRPGDGATFRVRLPNGGPAAWGREARTDRFAATTLG